MSKIKILLIKFGKVAEPDPRVNHKLISELVREEFSVLTCYVNKIPKIGEHFVVERQGYEDLVFNCVRFEGNEIKSKVDDHEYVVFASWVRRFSFIEEDDYKQRLLEFRT
ncbi:hypothetical protein ACOIXW_004809 [Vibrio parahaemolyticus]|nr:hypothetical protein [Vibrio parahaemolyticus]